MLYLGTDKLSSKTEIDGASSPDTVNSFFYNAKYNLLGPRNGVQSVNTTAFSSNANNGFVWTQGFSRGWLYSTTDGSVVVYTPPLANEFARSFYLGDTATSHFRVDGNLSGTVTIPTSPLIVTRNIIGAPINVGSGAQIMPDFQITVTASGTNNVVVTSVYYEDDTASFPGYPQLTYTTASTTQNSYTASWISGEPRPYHNLHFTNSGSQTQIKMKIELLSVGADVTAVSASINGFNEFRVI